MKNLLVFLVAISSVNAFATYSGHLKCKSKNFSFKTGFTVSRADGFYFNNEDGMGSAHMVISKKTQKAEGEINLKGSNDVPTEFSITSTDSKYKLIANAKDGSDFMDMNELTIKLISANGNESAAEKAKCETKIRD